MQTKVAGYKHTLLHKDKIENDDNWFEARTVPFDDFRDEVEGCKVEFFFMLIHFNHSLIRITVFLFTADKRYLVNITIECLPTLTVLKDFGLQFFNSQYLYVLP